MALLTKLTPVMRRGLGAGLLALLILFSALSAGIPKRDVVYGDVEAGEDFGSLDDINTGDTCWLLIATALVLLMTPGLAFFYGGMVRHKNVVSTIMQSFVSMGLITVLWTYMGFSLAFGDDVGGVGLFGNPGTYIGYRNVGAVPNPKFNATVPFSIWSLFQLVFAIITPALITGSFAERVRFSSLLLFMTFFHFLVYCPLAHMTWYPGGLLQRHGIVDFAGGIVVHMSSGWAALVGAWYLGPRTSEGSGPRLHQPSNLPFVLLGTALLWFGWAGFNGGSAGSASWQAAQAFLTTNAAAASSMLTWMLLDMAKGRKFNAIGGCAGVVVGLVAITSSAGFVTVGSALVIGIIGAIISNSVQALFQHRLTHRLDDTLDAFPCHGMGGTVGMILAGCFTVRELNPHDEDGLFYGGGTLFWHVLVAVLGVVTYVCLVSYLCYKVTDLILPLRVDYQEELMGLDKSQHGEMAMAIEVEDAVPLPFVGAAIPDKSGNYGKDLEGGSGRTDTDGTADVGAIKPGPKKAVSVMFADGRSTAAAAAEGAASPRPAPALLQYPQATAEGLGSNADVVGLVLSGGLSRPPSGHGAGLAGSSNGGQRTPAQHRGLFPNGSSNRIVPAPVEQRPEMGTPPEGRPMADAPEFRKVDSRKAGGAAPAAIEKLEVHEA